MPSPELQDLMLLYAAGAADEQETRRVEAWIASGAPEAAAALAEAKATLARLPEALEPAADTDAAWAKLKARVEADDEDRPAIAGVVGRRAPTPRGGLGRPAVAALVAAAVVISAGLAYFLTDGARRGALDAQARRIAQLEQEVLATQALVDAQLELIESMSAELDGQRRAVEVMARRLDDAGRLMRLVSAPELRTVRLAGADARPDAAGRVLWDPESGGVAFQSIRLDPPDAGRDYELWFITPQGATESLGTLTADERGATFLGEAPEGVTAADAVAVSVEPLGGSPGDAPTGPIVLLGEVN